MMNSMEIAMMKIVIFGAGKNAERLRTCIKSNIKIVSYIDNNPLLWGNEIDGIKICEPHSLTALDYNFVVIATINYKPIVSQLLIMGIDESKIATPFSFQHELYNQWSSFLYREELLFIEMSMKMEEMDIYLHNLMFETASSIERNLIRSPQIKSVEDTIHEIVCNKKSMSRFGDGEMDIMLGGHVSFQPYYKHLAVRLQEILRSDLTDHIVCLPDIYGSFDGRTNDFKNFFRRHLSSGTREKEYALINMDKEYYNAFVTRPYEDYQDKKKAEARFDALKSIWNGKKITIVEGFQTRMGVGNDLFAGASSIQRILAPQEDAFQKYDELLETVLTTDRQMLVLIALGPAATVLAYDLAQAGYWALDIGHVDIEYEWYLRAVTKKTAISGKYVNEVPEGHDTTSDCTDETYLAQIVYNIAQ